MNLQPPLFVAELEKLKALSSLFIGGPFKLIRHHVVCIVYE